MMTTGTNGIYTRQNYHCNIKFENFTNHHIQSSSEKNMPELYPYTLSAMTTIQSKSRSNTNSSLDSYKKPRSNTTSSQKSGLNNLGYLAYGMHSFNNPKMY